MLKNTLPAIPTMMENARGSLIGLLSTQRPKMGALIILQNVIEHKSLFCIILSNTNEYRMESNLKKLKEARTRPKNQESCSPNDCK
jgi:hypothetical protein